MLMANGVIRRQMAARSEFKSRFLNGPQRSVNRKAEGNIDSQIGFMVFSLWTLVVGIYLLIRPAPTTRAD
jgi:hypothetical protein